jgi:hypothetical protein
MIYPKKFKKMLVNPQVAKQHKISSWGLGSRDPAAKAHMMACDMQLKDFTKDVRRGSYL